MAWKVNPVSINASGSRDDVETARRMGRVQEHNLSGRPVQAVLDSPPYDSTCRTVTTDGTKCGNPIKSERERANGACYRHYWRQ